MKKLAFLISTLILLNGNVNAFGEDDLDYQEQLRQLKTEQAEDLESITTLYQHLETLQEEQKNFYFENTIFPALLRHEQYRLKISQLQWKKLNEINQENDRQFKETMNVLNEQFDLFNPNNADNANLLDMD
jgi:hypothetical protein